MILHNVILTLLEIFKEKRYIKMNQIAFNQQLSDKLNEVLNPTLYSTPGKGEITVVANEKNDLREYRIITENNKVVKVEDAYNAKHDAGYDKMMDFLKDYR